MELSYSLGHVMVDLEITTDDLLETVSLIRQIRTYIDTYDKQDIELINILINQISRETITINNSCRQLLKFIEDKH